MPPATMQADDDRAVTPNGATHAPGVILNNATAKGDADEEIMDPASLANAAHLDHLEASEAVADIASFQDVDLPPPPPPDPETGVPDLDLGDVESNVGSGDPPQSVRRAKKFYYCLPMVQMYRRHILGCVMLFAVFLTAVGVSVSYANRASANEQQAPASVPSEEGGGMKIDDAPAPGWTVGDSDGAEGGFGDTRVPDWEQTEGEDWDEGGEGKLQLGDVGEDEFGDAGDEELGDALEKEVTDTPTSSPREPGSASVGRPDQVDLGMGPRPSPTGGGWENDTPATSLGPRWYSTDHAKYLALLSDPDGATLSSHAIAGLFCRQEGRFLCTYEQYCPNGPSNGPWQDGPPGHLTWNSLEQVQWAPIYTDDTTAASSAVGGFWVQVGKMPASDEGTEDNGYGKCWTYEEWDNSRGGAIEDVWDEDHRRWLLCCENDDQDRQ